MGKRELLFFLGKLLNLRYANLGFKVLGKPHQIFKALVFKELKTIAF